MSTLLMFTIVGFINGVVITIFLFSKGVLSVTKEVKELGK